MRYEVVCRGCKNEYIQQGKEPEICGCCGSTKILKRILEEDEWPMFKDEGR